VAAAGGERDLGRRFGRQVEVAGRLVEHDQRRRTQVRPHQGQHLPIGR
jgi:hypothetical protein